MIELEPLKLGGRYSVPCFELFTGPDEDELWDDTEKRKSYKVYLIPVYDHPHNDRENGQADIHYHIDTRFKVPNELLYKYKLAPNDIARIYDVVEFLKYITKFLGTTNVWTDNKIKHHKLVCTSLRESVMTPTKYISKSKLKHQCIHRGKCPHRGYDLTQIPPIDGVITCPLHGLKFNSITKEIIKTE